MTCRCPVRGFRRRQLAEHIHAHMTNQPAKFEQCAAGWWHWRHEKETA